MGVTDRNGYNNSFYGHFLWTLFPSSDEDLLFQKSFIETKLTATWWYCLMWSNIDAYIV